MSELAVEWTRSSRCADNACVEVAVLNGDVVVRDSKNVDQQFLQFSKAEWENFTGAIAAGELRLD